MTPARRAALLLSLPLVLGSQCLPPVAPGAPDLWEGRWTGDVVVYLPEEWPISAESAGVEPGPTGQVPAFPTPRNAMDACASLSDDRWVSAPLFGDFEIPDEDLGETELGRFCWLRPGEAVGRVRPPPEELEALGRALAERSRVSRELVVQLEKMLLDNGVIDPSLGMVVALSGGVDPEASAYAVERTARAVGAAPPKALRTSGPPAVGVYVLDTHPAEKAGDSLLGYDHGASMVGLLQALLCPFGATGCAVQIQAVPAMPYQVSTSGGVENDPASPGHFGSPATVARAVRASSVAAHQAGWPGVFNLSLGWNPWLLFAGKSTGSAEPGASGSFAPDPAQLVHYGQLPAGSKAVMAALIDARCRGHLPVAAVGNRSNGSFSVPAGKVSPLMGPMLPARWMDVREGDKDLGDLPSCKAVTRQHDRWATGAPLLVAASGLDVEGNPSGLDRKAGASPFAALAAGVAVKVNGGTVLVDGTSGSAAITSAALAATWALVGAQAEPDEALERLRSRLPATGATPDFGAPAGSQVQVRICEILQMADPMLDCTDTAFPVSSPVLSAVSDGSTPLPAYDCAASPPPGHICDGVPSPTLDLRMGVIPMPPAVGCPPCDLEITGDELLLDLGPRVGELGPKGTWRTDEFVAYTNTVNEGSLEVRRLGMSTLVYPLNIDQLGSPRVGNQPERLGVPSVRLAKVSGVITSVTLVLSGTQGGKSVSWNVAVPVLK